MSFFYYYFEFGLMIFFMIVWHYMAELFFSLRRKPTAGDIRFYKICLTINRWLGYFILIYWFYYNAG